MRFRLFVLVCLLLAAAACTTAPEVEDDAVPVGRGTPEGAEAPTARPPGDTESPTEPTSPPTPTSEPTAAPEPTATAEPVDRLSVPEDGPQPPDDPGELAALIVAAEEAIRDPGQPPEALAAAGHWQQVAYRHLARRPELLDAVLAELPEELRPTAQANAFAGARLFAMHSPTDPAEPVEVRDLPAWRIVEPPPAEELLGYYRETEAETDVHWTYLAAIHLVETRMGRIQGTSVAGAQGPMQFMPATWGEWGEGDVNDPRDAIRAAGRYLRWGGMPDDVDGALYRYNRDVRYVDAVRTYAEQMQADPRAYYGYHQWQVYYFTGEENVWLPPGYDGSVR